MLRSINVGNSALANDEEAYDGLIGKHVCPDTTYLSTLYSPFVLTYFAVVLKACPSLLPNLFVPTFTGATALLVIILRHRFP